MPNAELLRIRLEVLRSDRDITGAAKKRGELFSKRIGNLLSAGVKAGVRSIDEDNQAEGYRDAVAELELVHGQLREGAYRQVFGSEPKPAKKGRRQ